MEMNHRTYTGLDIPAAAMDCATDLLTHEHCAPAETLASSTAMAQTSSSDERFSAPMTGTSISDYYYYKMLSACAGALITSLLVTPLDVVKTRLQSQPSKRPHKVPFNGMRSTMPVRVDQAISGELRCRYSHTACMCVPRPTTATLWDTLRGGWQATDAAAATRSATSSGSVHLRGTWDGLYTIMRSEGPLSLWRGLVPTLAMAVPSTVIYYVGYDHLRDSMLHACPDTAHLQHMVPLVAGGTMRATTATLISPIELVRTRMQSHGESRNLPAVLQELRRMVHHGGMRTLWRGLEPTLWRDVPFSAIYWLGYETIKQAVMHRLTTPDTTSNFITHLLPSSRIAQEFQASFLAGATSGTLAAIVTTPFDVAKTRSQVMQHARIPGKPTQQSRMMPMLRDIVQREGIAGLSRGMMARVAKVAPSCAVMIGTYEMGKRWFLEHNH